MRQEEDYCVQCDECHHCGNDKPKIYYICDGCGRHDGPIYDTGSEDLCLNCLIRTENEILLEYLRYNEILEQFANDCFERREEEG